MVSDHGAAANRPRIPVPVPESTIDIPDLIVSVELDDDTISAGGNLHGVAQLSNHGQGRIVFLTGGVLGGIRTEHGTCLAGGFAGPIAPAGIVVDLGAGETRELHVLVGTRSCGPDTVVPPGRYETVIRIPITFQEQDGAPSAFICNARSEAVDDEVYEEWSRLMEARSLATCLHLETEHCECQDEAYKAGLDASRIVRDRHLQADPFDLLDPAVNVYEPRDN